MKQPVVSKIGLLRALGLTEAVSIVVGTIIGTGIFLVPRTIAQSVHTSGMIFLVWIVSGVLSFLGALIYAELGSSMPRAGGEYVYLKAAYGPLWGFLYGWMMFLVGKSGSIATLAIGFSQYVGQFFNVATVFYSHTLRVFGLSYAFNLGLMQLVAIGMIVFLTVVNYFGVKTGGILQSFFTALKVGSILLLVILGFALANGSFRHFSPLLPVRFEPGLISAFGVAMIAALWAYDGWNNLNMVAGEIKNPERNLPRALILGTLAVILIYLLANLVYIYILPVSEIKTSSRVAADAAQRFLGGAGAVFFAATALISIFAALNGSILSGARIYYAMAEDGLFFKKVSALDPKYHTPASSLAFQALWSSVLTLTGTYDQLFTFVIFSLWIFYGMTAASVLILRKKHPGGPYKAPFHPYVPIVFVAMSTWLVINTLVNKKEESFMGLVLILLGLPAYSYWRRR